MTTVRKVYGVRNDGVEADVKYHFHNGMQFYVKT